MKNFLLFLFLGMIPSILLAQNYNVKGRIVDVQTGQGIESSTVYLSKIQDSTLVDYTISDKNGNFNLNIRKQEKPTRLKISSMVYQSYSKDFDQIQNDFDLGDIKLDIQSILIDSVVINVEAPPIRIKNDTLEFNAASFKVRPDANVEALLKQLPGVEMDSEGKIKVNGKEVNQILVNGKPFFSEDGKIAIQNLPAEIINKVQVSDYKTKEEQISKEKSTSDNVSINLTIDEDKNKGYFGRIMGGYGTDDRYEASGLINYFKGDLKTSVLASSNNINSSGFSMDEVFDNMGSSSAVSRGSFGGSARGSSSGITQSHVIGMTYSDKWGEKTDVNGNYFYNENNTENANKTKRINLLPDNEFITNSQSESYNDQNTHAVDLGFEIKNSDTSTFWITTNLNKSRNVNSSKSEEYSTDMDDNLLNESESTNYSVSDNLSFNNSIFYFKQFARNGRNMHVSLRTSLDDSDSDAKTKSQTYFYQNNEANDIRNQNNLFDGSKQKYSINVMYKEPITDSLSVNFGASYTLDKSENINKTYDFSVTTQGFTQYNDLLSNSIFSDRYTLSPSVRLQWRKAKYELDLNAATNITRMENTSDYLGQVVNQYKNYIMPNYNLRYRYKFNKSKSLSVRYTYNENLPSANQLLPVENLSNPLNTIIGNPDLDLAKSHSVNVFFNNYDYSTKQGYNPFINYTYYQSRIASISTYDENRKRTTTYVNIEDTHMANLGGNYMKNFKTESGHDFGLTLGANMNYSLNKGYTNNALFEANQYSISPRVELSYMYGDYLKINPNYRFTYNQTDYKNYQITSSKNTYHRFGLETTSYYPTNWTFGNDLGYSYNSNIAQGFKRDFFLWNLSLAYTFLNKQMTAKVKVYDVLNQNISNSRQISDIAIVDSEDLILKRYVMFSLSYKLENFAGKSASQNNKQGQSPREGGNRTPRMGRGRY